MNGESRVALKCWHLDDPALPPPADTTNSRVRNGIENETRFSIFAAHICVSLSLLFVGWYVCKRWFWHVWKCLYWKLAQAGPQKADGAENSQYCWDVLTLKCCWDVLTALHLNLFQFQIRHFTVRDAFPFQNGWIFGKVPNGLWTPAPPSFSESYVAIFSEIHDRSIVYNGKNLQHKFLDWKWPS